MKNLYNNPVVIFAGGYGSRLEEETQNKIPKPMVKIGGLPILFHIVKMWHASGFRNFVIAGGYQVSKIWDFVKENDMKSLVPDSIIDIVDTQEATQTAGRLRLLQPFLGDQRFFASYGDGVTSLDLSKLAIEHSVNYINNLSFATMAVTHPKSRFGEVEFDIDFNVTAFLEKPIIDDTWVNAGFFVFEPEIFRYIQSSQDILEKDVFPRLVTDRRLSAFAFEDFWHCMDTPKDKRELDAIWNSGQTPWKRW